MNKQFLVVAGVFAAGGNHLIAGCAGVVATEDAAQLETAVREWDSVTQVPAVPWSVELTPAQIRGLQRIRDQEGPTPTAQLRKAVRAWLESHDVG